MITARQRLAQRALRSLDLAPSPPPLSLGGATNSSSASSVGNDADNAPKALSSPVALVEKYGFHLGQTEDVEDVVATFKDPDDVRTLNVILAESDQCLFVSKEFMGAWSQQFNYLSSSTNNVQEICFPGGEAELQLILNAIWPTCKRISVEQIVGLLVPSDQWRLNSCLPSVVAYYLHSNTTISPSEKLKLASQSGNLLLLYGTLYYQCRRDTIFDIVNRSPDEYSRISNGAYSSYVISKMLEHAARDGDLDYKEQLGKCLHKELTQFKHRCCEFVDFSSPDEWRRTELVADGKSFFVNKSYLSVWSPVFHNMFYSDFRDRKQNRVAICDAAHEAMKLFLSLLHPSHMCAVWKLLPLDYVRNYRSNQWIDDLFVVLFDENVDSVVDVFKLAHKYQIACLIDVCVLMLETKSDYSIADKLLLADAYHLPTLMALCVAKFTSARGVKRLLTENENLLANLSCNAHRILLERMIDLV